MIKSNPQAMTITKQEVEELLDSLADKGDCLNCDANGLVSECGDIFQYPYHCPLCNGQKVNTRILPIYPQDVLEKMEEILETKKNQEFECLEELIRLWQPLGYTRSLQQIASQVEYKKQSVGNTGVVEEKAKPSPATDLFEFLLSLNL